MRCRSIVKLVDASYKRLFAFFTSRVDIAAFYPDIRNYDKLLNFFNMKRIYENEQLTKRILEVVPKYIESVKNTFQDIVNIFCAECEALPEVLPYEGEATFMLSVPIEKSNDNKHQIFFAISDVFDTMFLATPVDDVLLDVNILKSVKLKKIEIELIKIFSTYYDLSKMSNIFAILSNIEAWNKQIEFIKEKLDEWLKYQKKLSNEDLEKIIERKIEELKEVASYLQKLKKEPQAKMKLNCFQFYILQGLLHELMHYFFHYSLTEEDNESDHIEVWVNISANYIIDKLFDIRHLDIVLPVGIHWGIEADEVNWFARALQLVVQEYPRNPTLFRKFVESLPEKIAREIRNAEIDILLGNGVYLTNIEVNPLTRTITENGTLHIGNPYLDSYEVLDKIKSQVYGILNKFNTPIEPIEQMLVYRETEGKIIIEVTETPNILDMEDYQFVDNETFEKDKQETIRIVGSFFSPVILRYLNKEKGFENRKWKKKSIAKGMLYGTPFKKEYFKSTYGSVFLIIDTSGSMDNLFIQFATSAVYSTLRQKFSRVDITVVQFADSFVVDYYRNISVEQLFNIKPYASGGDTLFYKVTNAIATNPRLRMEYNRSDFVVLISDCEFQGGKTDYKYRIPLKPLVLFYPGSKMKIDLFMNIIRNKEPNTFPYNWLKQALVIDAETVYQKTLLSYFR